MVAIPLHSKHFRWLEIVSKEASKKKSKAGFALGFSSRKLAHLVLSLQRSTRCKSNTSAIYRASSELLVIKLTLARGISAMMLSDFAGEVWEQNKVRAGFGIGGRKVIQVGVVKSEGLKLS
ncbi:hypothetical protein Tco_0907716 [Tanacetum coccineum]|uniref:Uncharacterized protein n=1 Tax=Tanacetum coccineum TaxID=301880 RepID=A0ABQ5CK25_9ASTR